MKFITILSIFSFSLLYVRVGCQDFQSTEESTDPEYQSDPNQGVDMFGNPIQNDIQTRTQLAAAIAKQAALEEQEASGKGGGEGNYEESDYSITAEPEHQSRVINQELQIGPDQYDEHGLPPQIKQAKKKLKLEQKELKEQNEQEWWPDENGQNTIEEQQSDVVSKSEHIETGQDFAANQDINKASFKDTPVDMIDVSKELNITLKDVDTKINPHDPTWKKKEKLQIVQLLNPTDPTLIERDKYNKFIKEQIRTKQILAEKGYQSDQEEEEESRAVSTSISKDILKLCKSALLALIVIVFIIACAICVFTWCQKKNKNNGINREAELAEIRRQQQIQNQGMQKQNYWKDANGLEQVDEEGESYLTHYSDYRKSNPMTADFNYTSEHGQYNSQREAHKKSAGNGFYQSILSGGILDGGVQNNNAKSNNNRGSLENKSKSGDQSGKYRNRYQYQQQIDEDDYGDEQMDQVVEEQKKTSIGQWKDRRNYAQQREAAPRGRDDDSSNQNRSRVLRQSSSSPDRDKSKTDQPSWKERKQQRLGN